MAVRQVCEAQQRLMLTEDKHKPYLEQGVVSEECADDFAALLCSLFQKWGEMDGGGGLKYGALEKQNVWREGFGLIPPSRQQMRGGHGNYWL